MVRQVTVDGVTIGTEISKVDNRKAKIVFTTTGTDLGKVDEHQNFGVMVKVNEFVKSYSVHLTVTLDGNIDVYVRED